MSNVFYVYEHWRLDTDSCFYVGKGKGSRAYSRNGRNCHWKNIVSKLERIGSGYEIRLVATGLSEKQAFDLERERVQYWKNIVDLANKTQGGEGVVGLVMSEETRAKMSLKAKGRAGVKSMLGRKHSEETKLKMRLAKIGKKPNNCGKVYTKQPFTEEARKNMSIAQLKRTTGRKLSDKARENIRLGWVKRKQKTDLEI